MINTKMLGFRKSKDRLVIFLIFVSTSFQIALQDINVISQYVQNMQLRIIENKLGKKC